MPQLLSRIAPPLEMIEEFPSISSMAEKVLLILVTISQSELPLTLEAISTSTNLAKPTTFRLLNILVLHNFIERDPNGKRFQPSAKLRIIGINALSTNSVRSQRVGVMRRLVDEIGETCNFNILDGNQIMYLDRVETNAPIRLHIDQGMRVPLHCTASGLLFLAKMSEQQVKRLLGQEPFYRHSKNTITNYKQLFKELEKIRSNNFAMEESAFLDGFIGIAVPVISQKNKTYASITAHGPANRILQKPIEFYINSLKQAAIDIQNTMTESNQNL